MPLRLTALGLLLATAIAPARAAEAPTLRSDACGIRTDYDVLVDSGGIWLRHGPQAPHEVAFHDGVLSLDGTIVPVSDADAVRLRQLEAGGRQLMPAATALAHEVSGMTFEVFNGVYEMLTGTANSRKIRKLRRQADAWIDGSLGRGYWEQDTFGEGFDQHVEAMAESLAGSMARSVMWQVVTGRAGAIEKRAERKDKELDQRLEALGPQLEARARALCPLVQALADTQDALEVRYQGQPLQLLQRTDAVQVPAGQPRQGLHVSAGPDEHPRGNSVAPVR
ncbi:DUF2884 family protein [Stenotrophomonas sp. 24(2023)]|uniref:DUF2884 family protein n=1 Tax=Stenotrophomonas sp. 24(2023) TaxID=3068324 RepID=UPI0027E1065C|nr:DUF2884 family protein [Stenotrophomonas sp. 24(2023)]WMJ71285.1 DUF2884 family protein [Stenotrophomonas sp. 24(2023)]